MHCYVKQIIQTLRVDDHRCALLTNQQSHEENRLSSVFSRSREYPSGKFAPKGKSDCADAEKANKRSDRVDLREKKLCTPSVNLRPIQLVFSSPFYRSSTLTSRSSTLRTLIFSSKKHTLIKRMVRVLKISWNITESRSCPWTDHPDNFGISLVSQFWGSVLRKFL